MAKSKVTSSSSKPFVSGGKTKMFGKQAADTHASGVTGKVTTGPGGKGGKGHMFGKGTAQAARPGATAKSGN